MWATVYLIPSYGPQPWQRMKDCTKRNCLAYFEGETVSKKKIEIS